MLEKFAKVVGKYVVGLVVVLLAVAFASQFGGPQAEGCAAQSKKTVVPAEVYGQKITLGDFNANQRLLGFDRQTEEVRRANRLDAVVLNGLVDRTLLAREAEKLGFHASEEDAIRRLVEKESLLVSVDVDAPPSIPGGEVPVRVKKEDGTLDDEYLKNLIQRYLGRTVSEFAGAQVMEILAERMRDLVRSSVRVAPTEVWNAYVAETDRASVEYFRFSATHYREGLTLGAGELDAWMASNAAELDKQYEAQKHRYTGLDKQVRARQIFVKVEGEDPAAKAAAERRAEAARARAAAGADFAKLAEQLSEDEDTKKDGGDLGFTPEGRRPAPFDETVFALAAGQVSGVVEGPGGFYVWKVEAVREGDVPVDEAKREIAERLALDAKADALAKAAAEKALVALAAGTTFEAYDRQLAGLPPLRPGAEAPEGEEDPRGEDGDAPRRGETGSFGRGESPIPGLAAGPLVEAVFEMTEEAPLAKAPLKLGRDHVVYRLKERTRATEEAFTAEVKSRLAETLLEGKRDEAVKRFVHELRAKAEKDGAIRTELGAVAGEASGDV